MNRPARRLQVEALEDRTTPTFAIDTSFGNDGISMLPLGQGTESKTEVGVEPNGRIVVFTEFLPATSSGVTNPSQSELLGFNPDGSLDTTFGSGGQVLLPANANGGDMVVAPSGQIYLATNIGSTATVYRFNADGAPDTSYGTNGVATIDIGGNSLTLSNILLQPDGKLVVVGTGGSWTSVYMVARLNTDGSPDTTFNGSGLFLL